MIIISMLVGLGINFIGIDPIKALIYVGRRQRPGRADHPAADRPDQQQQAKSWAAGPTNLMSHVIGWFVTLLMAVVGIAAIVATVR